MRFTLVATVFATALSSAGAMRLVARQSSFPGTFSQHRFITQREKLNLHSLTLDCALDCVTNPKSYFGCSPDDNSCLCTNQQYVQETTQCIVDACNPSDADAAEAVLIALRVLRLLLLQDAW